MDHDCEGSGRELRGDPRPDEATTCPVCGRETRVDPDGSGGDVTLTIAHHQKVATTPEP